MSDTLERALRDLQFDMPQGLVQRAQSAVAVDTGALRNGPLAATGRIESGRRPAHREVRNENRLGTVLALIAAVLAVAIIAALVLTGRAVHPPQPAPANFGPAPTAEPISIGPPDELPVCTSPCPRNEPVFVSRSVGWIERGNRLFRTDDGGASWRPMISWQNRLMPGPSYTSDQLEVSADGNEVLLVTAWGVSGIGLIHTADGGRTWNSLGFPAAAKRTGQTCASLGCDPVVVFLNPREGWVVSKEGDSKIGDVFRTVDSGAHWDLIAHFAVGGELDLLHGQLVLESSTTAVFVPAYSGSPAIDYRMFRTQDSGRTWQAIALLGPRGLYAPNAAIGPVKFFDGVNGIAELQFLNPNGCCPTTYGPAGDQGVFYVYKTTDGGATWTAPLEIPSAYLQDFIDPEHWIEGYLITTTGVANPPRSPLLRTSDGGVHWETVASSIAGLPAGSFVRVNPYVFQDSLDGSAWLDCSSVMIRTFDGGSTWVALVPPAGGQLPVVPVGNCEP